MDEKEIAELEAKAKRADELEAQLKEKEEALSKYSQKDYNFQRLRDKSEEEISAIKKKMDEKERLMLEEVMTLTKEREDEKNRAYAEAKSEILESLSGGDKDLIKKIETEEANLAGEAKTAKELEDRYRKAYILATSQAPRANPIFSGYSVSYSDPEIQVKKFSESEDGKVKISSWFPEIANRIYKSNP